MDQSPPDYRSFLILGLLVISAISLKVYQNIQPVFANWYYLNRTMILFILAIFIFFVGLVLTKKITLHLKSKKFDQEITNGKKEDSVYAGKTITGENVYINLSFRRMHAQVVGTTNAGKTESVIVPWAIDDIEKGRGLIIIDGKADQVLLHKLYAYAAENNRTKDFRVFTLSDYKLSHTFNPLINDSVDQTTEKIINSFAIENEYYRTVQFDIFRNVLSIFKSAEEYPTFLKIRQAIIDPAKLQILADRGQNKVLQEWTVDFLNTGKETRKEQVSGLLGNLGYFTSGEVGSLFNTENPTMTIQQIMNEGLIAFFQLPVLKSPMLGKAVAKMVLQDIQSNVSVRHASGKDDHQFIGVYLDDFTEYLTKSFVSVLNKSRSANVGVTFSHQAIGDLEGLGPEVKNQIQTNTNLKVFMRTNEPDSAEYFSKTIGTKLAQKTTNRQKQGLIGVEVTADGSVRDVEEFMVHPNTFKNGLGQGEAILVLPHAKGSKSVRIKFGIRKNLKSLKIPEIYKPEPELLKTAAYVLKPNINSGIDVIQNYAMQAATQNLNTDLEANLKNNKTTGGKV